MKRTSSVLLAGLIVMALAVFPNVATLAQGNGLTLHLDQVDVTAYPQVTVHLGAWDANGLPPTGLSPSDFTLQVDSGQSFHPAGVQADSNAPLSVVLVLDISGSMDGQPLTDAKVAAARFLDRLSKSDHAALIAFNHTLNPDPAQIDPQREMAFTADLAPMYDLITGLRAGGDTHLYDAVAKAVQMAAGQPAGHRAILLLSDGHNMPPTEGDPQQGIKLAQASNLPVFVIGLGNQIDEPYLRSLASSTGGLYRPAPKSSELASLFSDMATLLKTQYLLTYQSNLLADGKNHDLAVTLVTASGTASLTLNFGPLPGITITPTYTPTFTPTITPTFTPTAMQIITPTFTPTPTPRGWKEIIRDNWGWLLAALVAIGAAIWYAASRPRRPSPKKETCAQCGYDLTGIVGACPQCGGSRRLPKP
jgi:VWFA-related protein